MVVHDIRIRPMTPADIAAVHAVEVATYPEPWPLGVFRDELTQPHRVYVVAEGDDGAIAGYAGMLVIGNDAHVTTVAVSAEHRGRALGTRLMVELVEEALRAGAEHLTLEVRSSNRAAQALYRKFGMAPVGVRKNYYRNEDALIMWVHDIQGGGFLDRLAEIRREAG